MADLKITGLTADTSPTSDDLVPTVDNPAGTPANKKVALGNVFQALIDNFQADTTNAAVTKPRMEIGWGVIVPGATTVGNETVSFHTAFSARPVVVITSGGDNISGTLTYGAGTPARNNFYSEAHSITSSGFQARVISPANWTAGDSVFYQWIAIGPA